MQILRDGKGLGNFGYRLNCVDEPADKRSMGRPAPVFQRVLTAVAMGAAFVVMASVFVPLRSGASEGGYDWEQAMRGLAEERYSTDPHEGLASLGSFEHQQYIIRAYATDGEPRFSIYAAGDGREIAALLSAKRVTELFPEVPLEGVDFSGPSLYMMVWE